MLERPSLHVAPWQVQEGKGRPQRLISDQLTREPLGFAEWRDACSVTWLRHILPGSLEVFETDDESHLLSLTAPSVWRRGWRVRDAEERVIGRVRGDLLLDEIGEMLGHFEGGRLFNRYGMELGNLEISEGSCIVAFQSALDGNPFARMLLLAAALTAQS